MPIYDYKCAVCSEITEQAYWSDSHVCQRCKWGAPALERYLGKQKFNFSLADMRVNDETSVWYEKFKKKKKDSGREDVGKKSF